MKLLLKLLTLPVVAAYSVSIASDRIASSTLTTDQLFIYGIWLTVAWVVVTVSLIIGIVSCE